MTIAADLRNLVTAARPMVERWVDLGEEFAELRDAATEKGFDWSQVKGLLKAQVQDGRDGGHRVEKIIERADNAASYATMLGLGKAAENKYSDPATDTENPAVPAAPVQTPLMQNVPLPEEDAGIPPFLDRRKPQPVEQAS